MSPAVLTAVALQERIAEPEEIAATVAFLARDLVRFNCGQVLGPNGGSVMV